MITKLMPFHDEEIQQSNNNQTNSNKRIQYQIDDKKSVTESKDENLSDITSILFTAPKITEIKKFRFLVVDDSSMNRKMLCRLLECEGHTCVQAVDGLDAVEKIKDNIQENIIENIREIMSGNLQKKIEKKNSRIGKLNELCGPMRTGTDRNRLMSPDDICINYENKGKIDNCEKFNGEKAPRKYSEVLNETLNRINSNFNSRSNTNSLINSAVPSNFHSPLNSVPTTKFNSKCNSKNNSKCNSKTNSKTNSKNNSKNNSPHDSKSTSYCNSPCEFLESNLNSNTSIIASNNDLITSKDTELYRNNFLFDAILMDFMMPNMDGPTATQIIREMGYEGLIIGVTGIALFFVFL